MNSKSRYEQQRGFTVAEVLTATAIFAVIFVAALMIYDRSNRVFKQGVEASDVQQNTRIAFDKMISELRMAGFDYDRDGLPSTANQYQQPDEQIEYAAPSAVTIRANLNYNTVANQGRETALENTAFPVVTTGNDEIVTYALASKDSTKNTDTITFYADVTNGTTAARHVFPGAGGSVEDTITINNVDLCTGGCSNPPYTLYRITLNGKGEPVRTAMADNIRSAYFSYFSDATGSVPLTVTDPGGGKYDPNNPNVAATVAARSIRSQIRSIGVQLIGMNENPDVAYTAPGETVASAVNYRQFRLESLVVPRNIGKRGMPEQQPAPPGAPTLNKVCSGYCGLAYVAWTAPAADPTAGSVEQYAIKWDIDNVGSYPNVLQVGRALNGIVTNLDPTATYYFTVAAINSYGSAQASQAIAVQPINRTQPGSPSALVASGGVSPSPAEQANVIGLTWTAPINNVSPNDQLTCYDPTGTTTTMPAPTQLMPEIQGWRVWRDTDPNFDPAGSSTTKVKVIDENAIAPLSPTVSGTTVALNDTTAANCYNYYYRVQAVERCNTTATNSTGSPACTGLSAFFPAVGSPAIQGRASTTVKPADPSGLTDTGSCTAGNCAVSLTWPLVTQDAAGKNASIVEYEVYREQKNSVGTVVTAWAYVATATPANATFNAGTVTYVDTGAPSTLPQRDALLLPYQYEYRILARQCSLQSVNYSNIVTFPSCVFAGGTITPSAPTASTGNGSAASPFQVDSPTSIAISTSVAVSSITATAYDAGTGAVFAVLTPSAPPPATFTTASFNWSSGSDGTTYRVDYIVKDVAGCQTSGSFFVEETSFSCCLIPASLDATIDTYDINTDILTIKLKNSCAAALTIRSVDIEWDADRVGGNTSKTSVNSVTYPKNPTGTVSGVQTTSPVSGYTTESIPGAGVSQVIASDTSGSYTILIAFKQAGNPKLGVTANPVGLICIKYRRSTDTTDQACKIAPTPSSIFNSCN